MENAPAFPTTLPTVLKESKDTAYLGGQYICHPGHDLIFDTEFGFQRWAVCWVDDSEQFPHIDRPSWGHDPKVDAPQHGNELYSDDDGEIERGHSIPVRSLKRKSIEHTTRAIKAGCFWSNCHPQKGRKKGSSDPGFNQGPWKDLEDWVAYRYGKFFEINGAVLTRNTVQYRGVFVPPAFLKIIVLLDESFQLRATSAFLKAQNPEWLAEQMKMRVSEIPDQTMYQIPMERAGYLLRANLYDLVSADTILKQRVLKREMCNGDLWIPVSSLESALF